MSLRNQEFWHHRGAPSTIAMQLFLLPGLIPSLGWSIPLLNIAIATVALSVHLKSSKAPPLSRSWMNILVAVSVGIWWWTFPSKLTLEPAVGLLLLGASLKLVEVKQSRDAYILIYSNIALTASLFLFDQSLWASITVLAVLLLALLALVEINTTLVHPKPLSRKFLLPLTILVAALPMTLIWFLIFPRIAPLWAIPVLGDSVKMGMSDTLRPGDVANLGQDASVAFRVEFSGNLPAYEELYWRGITLGAFDNGTWRQHDHLKAPTPGPFVVSVSRAKAEARNAIGDYRVFQTASHRSWLYQLNPSITNNDHVQPLADNTYQTRWPITSDLETSYALLNPTRPESRSRSRITQQGSFGLETAFPKDRNPQTFALVQQLKVAGNSEASVLRTLEWFRAQPLVYTLQPGVISDDNFVDRFLFETQSGFCEHFAYSFVVMMRLMDIPARIVGGYMGGEVNPLSGTVTVRELDAHAWAEVWIQDVGWLRVDPTATIAPDRIELGSLDSLAGTGGFLDASPLSLLHLRDWRWVNRIRLELDDINYRWQSGVMSYQREQQSDLLTEMLGEITASRLLVLLGLGLAVTFLPVGLFLTAQYYQKLRSPKYRAYRDLARTLKAHGIEAGDGETLRKAAKRALLLPSTDHLRLEAQLTHFEQTWYGASE